MAYKLLSPADANSILLRHEVRAEDIPSYGLIVTEPGLAVLVFRKTDGQILVIDVTGQVPAHFYQKFPADPKLLAFLVDAGLALVDPTGAGRYLIGETWDQFKATLEQFKPPAWLGTLAALAVAGYALSAWNEARRHA
jgi:hypothetical protein